MPPPRARNPAIFILGIYACIVLISIGRTPLWLDEILQASSAHDKTLSQVIQSALINRGGVPLPYLLQEWTFDVFGYSTFSARFPAALFSIASGVLFVFVCRQLKLRNSLVALVLFLCIPLQFRYGVEARGYSQGLFFSLVILSLGIRLRRPARYTIVIVLGLYSQPFAIFVPAGQALWAFAAPPNGTSRLKKAAPFLLGIAVAVVCFAPWLALQHQAQTQRIEIAQQCGFAIRQIYPLVLLREFSGGGYFCSLTLMILIAAAFLTGDRTPWKRTYSTKRSLLLCILAATFFGPLLADAAFSYFFADRQLIFILPVVAILAAEGAAALQARQRHLAPLLIAVFLIAAGIKDYRQATTPKEDWARVAEIVVTTLPREGCLITEPAEHASLFSFFRKDLASRECQLPSQSSRILVVSDPYTSDSDREATRRALNTQYKPIATSDIGRFRIVTMALNGSSPPPKP